MVSTSSYLGGMLQRHGADGIAACELAGRPSPGLSVRYTVEGKELFLQAQSGRCWTATRGRASILLRGYADPFGFETGATSLDDLLGALLEHYWKHGDLPIERLEGSFTLALIDGKAGRIVLYRNIVGTGFTYYTRTADGLLFGGNLADLIRSLPRTPEPNHDALPAYFLFRSVPGRETLFKNVYRLMPGEMIRFDADGLHRAQRLTIGDLRGSPPVEGDPSEWVDEAMGRILADWAAHRPRAANLLSGGVDSSYLQVHWNRVRPQGEGPPVTFTASVDHPGTRGDDDYATSAAEVLGTRHTLVPVEDPIAACLVRVIAGTGEPPNHMQASYFRPLARRMGERGVNVAICGEGADSLFGVGSTVTVQMARLARRTIPGRRLRALASALAERMGHPRLPIPIRLADRLGDVGAPDHPLNQVAVFTDLDAVIACFGAPAVAEGFAFRRRLLDQYRVGNDLRERVNLVGFLGEAMDSGSLWATLFDLEGCEMVCPFLDSRMIRLVASIDPVRRYPFRKPKELLKRSLRRRGLAMLADRTKRGFGQPILEWMAPGGRLRPLVESIGRHDFVAPGALAAALRRPNWFLYSLLCYDLWHKSFIEGLDLAALAGSHLSVIEMVGTR